MKRITWLILLSFTFFIGCGQRIPLKETEFTIQKKEKQRFYFTIERGYLLKAIVEQKGVDLGIKVFKKGDSNSLALFDSPNGEYGPEPINFESRADGEYFLEIAILDEDTASQGKYSIRQISIKKMGVIYDTAFSQGSSIVISGPSALTVENLKNLGMVWGFLKYHLPANAAGDFNWDAQLFRVMPKVIAAQSKADASKAIEQWVDAIGKPEACKSCKPVVYDGHVKMMPDYGDIFVNGNLDPSLIKKLAFIRDNRNQGTNYWVSMAAGIGNPIFDHENPYDKMVYPDAGYRLLGLFRYWNMIQYFFPYKYLIGNDWNKALTSFIPVFIKAKNSVEYTLACLEMIASVHDSHANIWSNETLNNYFGKNQVPVQAEFIENQLVVTNYKYDTLDIKDKLKIGDIIISINGRDVKEWVNQILYLTPASNLGVQLRALPGRTLLCTNEKSLTLQISRNNDKKQVVVSCIDAKKIDPFFDFNPNPGDSSFKIISNHIGYLYPGRYKNNQLEQIKKAFKETSGMIIDMRTYPSNFMPFTFGAYIKPKSSPFVKFTSGDVNAPGLFRFGDALSNGESNLEYYKGPIVELVNSFTQSQAEYTTMAFQTAPNYTVIGTMTAGADGNVSSIVLPGGIHTLISGIGVYYPNGDETQRVGIRIDMQISPTIEGIRNGKDELLEKAIEIINQKNKQKQ